MQFFTNSVARVCETETVNHRHEQCQMLKKEKSVHLYSQIIKSNFLIRMHAMHFLPRWPEFMPHVILID